MDVEERGVKGTVWVSQAETNSFRGGWTCKKCRSTGTNPLPHRNEEEARWKAMDGFAAHAWVCSGAGRWRSDSVE